MGKIETVDIEKVVLEVLNGHKEPFDKEDEGVKVLAIFSESFEDIADKIAKRLTMSLLVHYASGRVITMK